MSGIDHFGRVRLEI